MHYSALAHHLMHALEHGLNQCCLNGTQICCTFADSWLLLLHQYLVCPAASIGLHACLDQAAHDAALCGQSDVSTALGGGEWRLVEYINDLMACLHGTCPIGLGPGLTHCWLGQKVICMSCCPKCIQNALICLKCIFKMALARTSWLDIRCCLYRDSARLRVWHADVMPVLLCNINQCWCTWHEWGMNGVYLFWWCSMHPAGWLV
jgi:hypothetical protein